MWSGKWHLFWKVWSSNTARIFNSSGTSPIHIPFARESGGVLSQRAQVRQASVAQGNDRETLL
jgi:hypothetical protein